MLALTRGPRGSNPVPSSKESATKFLRRSAYLSDCYYAANPSRKWSSEKSGFGGPTRHNNRGTWRGSPASARTADAPPLQARAAPSREIHHTLEGDEPEGEEEHANRRTSFAGVITQIMLFDIVFSLDSVITAVGMANTLASAIVVAVVIMLVASGLLADFVQRYPTIKMLALSFLMLIGMTLIADGAGFHVPKGYIYAAIGFSVGVEALNQLAARRRQPRGGVARHVSPIKRRGGSANMRNSKLVR